MVEGASATYRVPAVALGYDVLNALLWLPTGSGRLRRRFVTSLGIAPGSRVLELGCGSGLVTRHLTASSRAVTAVDSSASMLRRAQRRAPSATFVPAYISDFLDRGDDEYDCIVFGFVLHEFDQGSRVGILSKAARRLAPAGTVGILEWSLPRLPIADRAWRATIRRIETPVALEVLDGAIEIALAAAHFHVVDDHREAGGRARVLRARDANDRRR